MRGNQPNPFYKGDRLKQLRAFCHAARLGSISRAAERVMSSQPAVSLQVRTLEEELGVMLFERHGPRIALTRVGENLYKLAMPLVEGMDRLPNTFAERYYGIVEDAFTIGASQTSASYLLPNYVQRFRDRHPGIRVNVKIGAGQERLSWLRTYEVDVILAAMDVAPPDVDFQPVFVSQPTLITPEDHPLAGRESVDINEIAGYPMVGHPPGKFVQQLGDMIMRLHGFAPKVAVEVEGWSAIKRYVESGLGIAFVPDVCLAKDDRVWRIPLGKFAPPRRYGAITRHDGLMSLGASRFLQILASPDSSGA